MTTTTCDICEEVVRQESIVDLKFDDRKVGELCEKCASSLQKLFRGGGASRFFRAEHFEEIVAKNY